MAGSTRQQVRHAAGSSSGGEFKQHRGDAASVDLIDGASGSLGDRQSALEVRIAALNLHRLALHVDASLPVGVVRCDECGRFASEQNPMHECPQRVLVRAGYDPEQARRLAWAGFVDPETVEAWRDAIEKLGLVRAGCAKALGVPPDEAIVAGELGRDFEADYEQQGARLAAAALRSAERQTGPGRQPQSAGPPPLTGRRQPEREQRGFMGGLMSALGRFGWRPLRRLWWIVSGR